MGREKGMHARKSAFRKCVLMREPGSHVRSTRYERTLGPARVARPRVARFFYTIRPSEAQIGHTIRRRYAAQGATRRATRVGATRRYAHADPTSETRDEWRLLVPCSVLGVARETHHYHHDQSQYR